MTKKLLVLDGSPHMKGNSTVLAARAAEAARGSGMEVEILHLSRMKISPCYACDRCKEGKKFCILKDDMQEIYPKLLAADALLLASPIYWFTYSAQLKNCIDRWYGLWNNRHDFLRGKPVGIILSYEDASLEVSGGINAVHSLESTINYIGARYVGCVHGSMAAVGDAEKNPEIMESAAQMGIQLAAA